MNYQLVFKKLQIITVEPVLLVYIMIIFLESNGIQELILVKSCLHLNRTLNYTNYTDCIHGSDDAMEVSTAWNKYIHVCLFSISLLSSLYAGSWCDLLGRKVPMLIPLFGTALSAIINCLLAFFIYTHIAFLFIGSVITGITFGSTGVIAGTFGYLSDLTTTESRTKRIVVLETMLVIGAGVGKYLSGVFVKDNEYKDKTLNGIAQLFLFEAGAAMLIAAYVYIRIPRYEQRLQLTSWKALFSVQHLIDSVNAVIQPRDNGNRLRVLLMLLATFTSFLGLVVMQLLGYYYTKEVLHFNMEEYSLYGTLDVSVKGAVLLIVLPLFYNILHLSDYAVNIIGMLSRVGGLAFFGLSTTPTMLYCSIPLFMFSELPVGVLRSLLSKHIEVNERGKIFAFTSTLQNVSWIIGSLVFLSIFTEFTFRGLCFEIVAGLQILPLLIIIYLCFTAKNTTTTYVAIANEDEVVVKENIVTFDEPVLN